MLISNKEGKGEGKEKEEVVQAGWAEEEIRGKRGRRGRGMPAGLAGKGEKKRKRCWAGEELG